MFRKAKSSRQYSSILERKTIAFRHAAYNSMYTHGSYCMQQQSPQHTQYMTFKLKRTIEACFSSDEQSIMKRPRNVFYSSTTMIHMYVCLESLYPETTADKARATNAKKVMLIAAAVASVKLLTTADLMRFMMGTAAESADISKYATACKCIHRSLLDKLS